MDSELTKEIKELQENGLKTNPLRLEYEEKVHELSRLKDELFQSGLRVEEIARILHGKRRELGKIYLGEYAFLLPCKYSSIFAAVVTILKVEPGS